MGGCGNNCIFRRLLSFRVRPRSFNKKDIIGKAIEEELQVSIMYDRLNAMFNHADAFIALPGGLGTLEEIFHIFS